MVRERGVDPKSFILMILLVFLFEESDLASVFLEKSIQNGLPSEGKIRMKIGSGINGNERVREKKNPFIKQWWIRGRTYGQAGQAL